MNKGINGGESLQWYCIDNDSGSKIRKSIYRGIGIALIVILIMGVIFGF